MPSLPIKNTINPTAPFQYFVLDVKLCGIDEHTGKSAALILFMEAYTGIVFHSQYTTQTGQGVLVKFLRYIVNKYNFGNLNVSYNLITAFDEPFHPVIKNYLADADSIIFNPELSNKLCEKVRSNYVGML